MVLTDDDMPGRVQLLQRVDAAYPGVIGMLITGHDEYPEVLPPSATAASSGS